jgi:hypothetical protein
VRPQLGALRRDLQAIGFIGRRRQEMGVGAIASNAETWDSAFRSATSSEAKTGLRREVHRKPRNGSLLEGIPKVGQRDRKRGIDRQRSTTHRNLRWDRQEAH